MFTENLMSCVGFLTTKCAIMISFHLFTCDFSLRLADSMIPAITNNNKMDKLGAASLILVFAITLT